VNLITEARMAVDQVIDQAGRSLIQTIFLLSAEQVAGPKTPGKTSRAALPRACRIATKIVGVSLE
jgi:hypothetical protein